MPDRPDKHYTIVDTRNHGIFENTLGRYEVREYSYKDNKIDKLIKQFPTYDKATAHRSTLERKSWKAMGIITPGPTPKRFRGTIPNP